jgi:hypothetical protein
MYNRPPFLLELLHFCEFIAVIGSIYKFNSLKKTYWKWFVFYLIYILMFEISSAIALYYFKIKIGNFISLFQIPIEYIFFYWLYAYISLNKKMLFWFLSIIYLFSLFLEYTLTINNFSGLSLNKTFGTLLLLALVVLEFIKQIKSDSILNFKENKMFYINIGVVLFYVGNMPFFGLYFLILKEPQIWNSYYVYFLISNCIMYLLFAASFIWGKPKS